MCLNKILRMTRMICRKSTFKCGGTRLTSSQYSVSGKARRTNRDKHPQHPKKNSSSSSSPSRSSTLKFERFSCPFPFSFLSSYLKSIYMKRISQFKHSPKEARDSEPLETLGK